MSEVKSSVKLERVLYEPSKDLYAWDLIFSDHMSIKLSIKRSEPLAFIVRRLYYVVADIEAHGIVTGTLKGPVKNSVLEELKEAYVKERVDLIEKKLNNSSILTRLLWVFTGVKL